MWEFHNCCLVRHVKRDGGQVIAASLPVVTLVAVIIRLTILLVISPRPRYFEVVVAGDRYRCAI
jgi:hypothetical protein